MNIGIDISQIVYGTGVSWYTRNLVENLLRIKSGDKYLLFGGSLRRLGDLRRAFKEFKGNFTGKYFPIPPTLTDFIWNKHHVLPIELLVGKMDVFHSSDWAQPPSKAYKVTTIHDLTPIIFPDQTDLKVREAHKRRLGWVKKEVDKVIAVSNATKKDIVNYLGIPGDKITVIYEAPDPIYKKSPENEIESIKRKYNITGDYVLSVGTAPRKNLGRISRAVEDIGGLKHVVVGQGAVKPNNTELAALYSGAEALAYASLYEGFGLPILEAYSCGCPVVTSNVSSMPEIAGDGAVLIDPDSVESIAEGIIKAIGNRHGLIEKGNLRLKDFSWEKTARQTLDVYGEAGK